MKKITSVVVSVALTVSMLPNVVQNVTIHADNPLAQNVYTADPAPMVHGAPCRQATIHHRHRIRRVRAPGGASLRPQRHHRGSAGTPAQ